MKISNPPITNIVFSGVGGQGIILASALVTEAALSEGYDVKANEVHGMAQRGGSVICQIRYGEKIHSPLVQKGAADFLVALEIIEALRYVEYMKPEGLCLVNSQRIIPTTVSSGIAEYPADPESSVKDMFPHYKITDCLTLAQKAGSARCVNVVMVGWLSRFLPFSEETWQSVLKNQLQSKRLVTNQKAFLSGRTIED
ncbi:indolepyruvate oxidoreductase subunit beta [Candidatus Sumerlaeota bacterium]|nr:indolepyruvate oxidoreductase subunit beta [Candidatus Sumerlaeota bacterium]